LSAATSTTASTDKAGGYQSSGRYVEVSIDDYGHAQAPGAGAQAGSQQFSYPPSLAKQLFQAPPPGRGVHGQPGAGVLLQITHSQNSARKILTGVPHQDICRFQWRSAERIFEFFSEAGGYSTVTHSRTGKPGALQVPSEYIYLRPSSMPAPSRSGRGYVASAPYVIAIGKVAVNFWRISQPANQRPNGWQQRIPVIITKKES
jgi:hypothetical protein